MNLKKKIFLLSVITSTLVLIISSIIALNKMDTLRGDVLEADDKLADTIATISSVSVERKVMASIQAIVKEKATVADNQFSMLIQNTKSIADVVAASLADTGGHSEIKLRSPEEYGYDDMYMEMGVVDGIDENDPELIRKMAVLDEVVGIQLAVNHNSELVGQNYLATQDGIFVLTSDGLPIQGLEEGNYDFRKAVWYTGAAVKKNFYISPVSIDPISQKQVVYCSVPFYEKGVLKGVVASAIETDSLQNTLSSSEYSLDETSCLISDSGRVIFSESKEGELAESGFRDLRSSKNQDLADAVKSAVKGDANALQLKVDDVNKYVAFAPLPTVGWTLMTTVGVAQEMQSTNSMLGMIHTTAEDISKLASEHVYSTIRVILIAALLITILVLIASSEMASRIVNPIKLLTDKVKKIDGDNMEFTWDVKTRDETQVLGQAFLGMTETLKEYIKNITEITAEKERIGAELNVATQIQADMLPNIFPPFPERKDFIVYATMTPAKEVGGDFYDFFLIDDNHLALVMADVSGKGVPAALFMVIAKTLIKDHAQFSTSPAEILGVVNNLLCENNEADLFVTVWLGILELDTGILKTGNAGHEYPVFGKKGEPYQLLKTKHSIALAAMEGMVYRDNEIQLQPGDRLFLYTDGVPEATNGQNEMFGNDRMLEALNQNMEKEPEQLLPAMKKIVDEFVGDAPQFDDLTMLSFVYKGEESEKKTEKEE